MAGTYEQAVGIVAGSTALQGSDSGSSAVVIDRDGVTGAPWMDDGSKTYTHTWSHVKWPPQLDLYWWTDFVDDDGDHFTYVTGANYSDSWFGDSTKPWQIFLNYPRDILHALASWPYENDDYSPNSVTFAANMITGINNLLEKWIPQFNTWANDVNASDSDFQGSAAGVLKQQLTQFKVQLQSISNQLTSPDLAADLNSTAGDMVQGAKDLSAAYDTWWDGSESNPFTLVHNEFTWAINNATITKTFDGENYTDDVVKISTPHGDPMTPDFWSSIESQAKAYWTQGLGPLDTVAQSFISTLSTSYDKSGADLPKTIVQPPAPPPPTDNKGDNGGSGGSGGGPGGGPDLSKLTQGGSGGGGTGGPGGGPDLSKLTQGGSGGGGIGGGAGGGGNSDLAAAGAGLGGLSNLFNSAAGPGGGAGGGPADDLALGGSSFGGPGSGGDPDTLTGPNGNVLTGPDGDPLTVPPGSTVGPGGTVLGPDGKPVLGADGKPLTVPPGTKLSQGGGGLGGDLGDQDTVIGPDGKPLTGPDGTPLTVPPGSTIRSNGSVVGPDGKPILGADGKPLTVPGGSSLSQTGADGLNRDTDNGNPDDEFLTGNSGSGGLGGSTRLLGAGGTLPKGLGGTGGLSGLRQTGSGIGLSERAKAAMDPDGTPESNAPGGDKAAQEDQAVETAADEDQMLGRVATVGGTGSGSEPPMMPPMSGGMGGMGGGATTGRKTWITEDEETWGTGTGSGTGVIGR